MKRLRELIFLKDVWLLSWTAFGGPQAHVAMFFSKLVDQRNYVTEEELIEINALCQILPGPTSTQTLTAIAYKLGGYRLVYLTLLLWSMPGILIMTTAAILIRFLESKQISTEFTRFIQPMAIAFMVDAALKLTKKIAQTKTAYTILITIAVFGYFFHQPWMLPFIILSGGLLTTFKYKRYQQEYEHKFKVRWINLTLFGLVYGIAGFLSEWSGRLMPFRLLENFYRTGSLIFGGGQVLVPMLFAEYVKVKNFVSGTEFLTGYSLSQVIPGPTFSFASFVGALCMRDYGIGGEILGGVIAAAGVFLPGTFLMLFSLQMWLFLKQYRPVKASLEGINASALGLVVSGIVLMLQVIIIDTKSSFLIDFGIITASFLVLQFTKISPPLLILVGLLVGGLLQKFG